MQAAADAREDGEREEAAAGVRLIVLNLPEDEGEGLGFRLTRTLWDPYPWVREVTPESRADSAGLRAGDCLLQADGKDLLGMPIGRVAGAIRGDGSGRGVSLLCWNCGVDPHEDPELLWSCGGGARGERARRALAGAVRALACCVCAATASKPLNCARSHLYCESCWSRLDRCALCRESLPPKDSPYARNLVAEQVFEAIASEYDVKEAKRRPRPASARSSPACSPPAARRGHYQLSAMVKRRAAQCTDRFASDPNLRQSVDREMRHTADRPTSTGACKSDARGSNKETHGSIPSISVEQVEQDGPRHGAVPQRLAVRLRQACSLADLQEAAVFGCRMSHSVNDVTSKDSRCDSAHHSNSMDNLKSNIASSCDVPVFVLSAPPVYVLTCDHNRS